METKLTDFNSQLKFGKEFEDDFAKLLISCGWFVTPKYLFASEGAPLLLGSKNSYPIPDIDSAKEGVRLWFEVKRKKRMFKHPATGFTDRLWESYYNVQKITGDKLILVFKDETDPAPIFYGGYFDKLRIYSSNFPIYNFYRGQQEPHVLYDYPGNFIHFEMNEEGIKKLISY